MEKDKKKKDTQRYYLLKEGYAKKKWKKERKKGIALPDHYQSSPLSSI